MLSAKKILLAHQKDALTAVSAGLSAADRGKLIMACGTGKTFTSLKIAEAIAGKGQRVLFMVPSLALMSQTVREWTNDTDTPNRYAIETMNNPAYPLELFQRVIAVSLRTM